MSANNSSSSNSNRNGYIFPDFSLRRLLLQTRTGRASYTARMCDVERGSSSSISGTNGIGKTGNGKNNEKSNHGLTANSGGDASSNRVSSWLSNFDLLLRIPFCFHNFMLQPQEYFFF